MIEIVKHKKLFGRTAVKVLYPIPTYHDRHEN